MKHYQKFYEENLSNSCYYPNMINFAVTNLKNKVKLENNLDINNLSETVNFEKKQLYKKSSISEINDTDLKTFLRLETWVYYLSFKPISSDSSYHKPTFGYFPYTTYVCPYFDKYKETETPVVCNFKNVIKGEMGMTIMCDQPVFAHTLYNEYNYGNNKEEKNYAEWETKANEIGEPFVSDSICTYTVPETPEGNWYTTIVHFADGTVYQTEPAKK